MLKPEGEAVEWLDGWLDDSSQPRTYGDGSSVQRGPYATIIVGDFDKSPNQLLTGKPAEGALVMFADEQDCDDAYVRAPSFEPPHYQDEWRDRLEQLVFRNDGQHSPVVYVGLSRSDIAIRDQIRAALEAAGASVPPGLPVIAISLSGMDSTARRRLPLPSIPRPHAIQTWAAKMAMEQARRAKGQDPHGGMKWRPNGSERRPERLPACTICGRPEGRNHDLNCDRAWKLPGQDRRVTPGDCISDDLRNQGGGGFNVRFPR